MISRRPSRLAVSRDTLEQSVDQLTTLIQSIERRHASESHVRGLRDELERFAQRTWSKSEIDIVHRHLVAAGRFLEYDEIGAACHELITLRQKLTRLCDE